MSELLGGDETLFSLWPEHFLSKPLGLDWPFKDQQLVPIPILLLDDGRVALKSDGVEGVTSEDAPLPQSLCSQELPPLNDASIKSMLVHESELSLANTDMPNLSSKDVPASPVDDDFNALVSFRCQYCSFSSADVPSLMNHSKTEHAQPESLSEQSCDSVEEVENMLPTDDPQTKNDIASLCEIVEQFVYLCSECKEDFTSVSQCRDHMIKDHHMILHENKNELAVEEEDDKEIPGESQKGTSASPTPLPTYPPSPPTPSGPKPVVPTFPHTPVLTKPFAIIKPSTKSRSKEYDPDFEAKPHKCPVTFCVHKFRTLGCLESHLECHAQGDPHHFICPNCSMIFVKWGQCSLHLWKEHNIDIDLYVCQVCKEYKTTTRKKLESHAKIHSEERPYKCAECGKGFKQRTQLTNHSVSVHSKDKANAPKWYMSQKCEICHKTYADSKCLKKHMQAVHSKLRPYKCHICSHMSARKAMLQAHMRQHTGEKPFLCEMCPFKTGDHNSLRRHMMRHTGIRPYKCPHCPYSSIQSTSFKCHLQNRHPGQSGVFTCSVCYFVTVSEQSYHKHMSDHKLNLIPPNEVEVFPENLEAARLVYRSFGAPPHLHRDLTTSSTSHDRMKQTITINIPPHESVVTDDEDTTHCYLTGDEMDTGGITIPAQPEPESQPATLICFD